MFIWYINVGKYTSSMDPMAIMLFERLEHPPPGGSTRSLWNMLGVSGGVASHDRFPSNGGKKYLDVPRKLVNG